MYMHKDLFSIVTVIAVFAIVIIAFMVVSQKNGAGNQTISNPLNSQLSSHPWLPNSIALFDRSQLNATGACTVSSVGTNAVKTVCQVGQNISEFKLLGVRYDVVQLLLYNTCVEDANNTALFECEVENISTGSLPALYCISKKALTFDWTNLINNTAGFVIYNGSCPLSINAG